MTIGRTRFCIVGLGESEVGHVSQGASGGLTITAALRALKDAGLKPYDVNRYLRKPSYHDPTYVARAHASAGMKAFPQYEERRKVNLNGSESLEYSQNRLIRHSSWRRRSIGVLFSPEFAAPKPSTRNEDAKR